MKPNKIIPPEQESGAIKKKDDLDKKNCEIKKAESFEPITEDGVLKPTNELYKNFHSKPADEQQFDGNEQNIPKK